MARPHSQDARSQNTQVHAIQLAYSVLPQVWSKEEMERCVWKGFEGYWKEESELYVEARRSRIDKIEKERTDRNHVHNVFGGLESVQAPAVVREVISEGVFQEF